jgi:hypothetical protein
MFAEYHLNPKSVKAGMSGSFAVARDTKSEVRNDEDESIDWR